MLNHASWVNSKRMESEEDSTASLPTTVQNEEDPVVHNGKRLSELTSDDMAAYYGDWGA